MSTDSKAEQKSTTAAHEAEWSQLMSNYYRSIDFTAGCGSRGHHSIDDAHAKLREFAALHKLYQTKLPKKHVCQDDGMGGASGAFAALNRYRQ